MVFLGRSDTVLNPVGIRSQDFTEEVIILFVKLKNNNNLSEEHRKLIKDTLKSKCSPHHVPRYTYAVSDIPKTRSGKIVEAAVRAVTENKSIKNLEAIYNPKCLCEFEVGRE
jgi:acetoacetyl-CoA synthetase